MTRRIVLYYVEWPAELGFPNRGWFSVSGDWRVVSASQRRWLWASKRSVSREDYGSAAGAARRLARHAGARIELARDRRWALLGDVGPDGVGPPPSTRYVLRGREDLRVLTGALRVPDPEEP